MMRSRRQVILLTFVGCLAVTLVSCDKRDGRLEIQGKVTYQKEQVLEGKILFMPVDESRPQAIASIIDGEYKTASPGGVFPGDYKVQVFGYRGTGKVQDLGELHGKQEQQEQYLPAKFNHSTELTLQISSEKREYDFDL